MMYSLSGIDLSHLLTDEQLEIPRITKEVEPVIEQLDAENPERKMAFPHWGSIRYWAFIKKYQPRNIIEVGAGYSTLLARKAAPDARIMAIDNGLPQPLIDKLIAEEVEMNTVPVQEIPPSYIAEIIGPSDILFIDSSHIAAYKSDVPYLYLGVLPKLKVGAIVHVHDIFLPDEYPDEWKDWGFNEQYVLAAFLYKNPDFQILSVTGGSWWLRRV